MHCKRTGGIAIHTAKENGYYKVAICSQLCVKDEWVYPVVYQRVL